MSWDFRDSIPRSSTGQNHCAEVLGPFDRMLIAQGLMENMLIVTPDVVFDQYGVKRFW